MVSAPVGWPQASAWSLVGRNPLGVSGLAWTALRCPSAATVPRGILGLGAGPPVASGRSWRVRRPCLRAQGLAGLGQGSAHPPPGSPPWWGVVRSPLLDLFPTAPHRLPASAAMEAFGRHSGVMVEVQLCVRAASSPRSCCVNSDKSPPLSEPAPHVYSGACIVLLPGVVMGIRCGELCRGLGLVPGLRKCSINV